MPATNRRCAAGRPFSIGWFMTFLVAVEGLVMYFLSERYASFWGYGPLDPVSSFATIAEGYSLVMVGAFWVRRCVLRYRRDPCYSPVAAHRQ